MRTNTTSYFAYLRKSSESRERQALSIDAQQRKIEEYFPTLDIEFIVEERSAFKPYNRPIFDSMLKRITRGERTGLVVWHPDRLSRNEIDAAQIVYMLRAGLLHDLKLATYPFDNTPEGIWMLQNALSQSQYESAKKGRDVKRGLEQKALQGHPPYPAIVGYRNTPHLERGFKRWEKDPERFHLVRELWDRMLTGRYSPIELLQIAHKELGLTSPPRRSLGGRPLARSAIYRLFRERAYSGRFEYPKRSGIWYSGAYPPMISDDEFECVQQFLDQRTPPASSIPALKYKGLYLCGTCRARATAEQKVRARCSTCRIKFSALNRETCPKCNRAVSKVDRYHYYHCTHRKSGVICTQGATREEVIHSSLQTFAKSIWLPESAVTWRPRTATSVRKQAMQKTARRRQELQTQLTQIDEKLARLIALRVSGEITADELADAKNSFLQEKTRLTVAIKRLKRSAAESEEQFRSILKLANEGVWKLESDGIDDFRPLLEAALEEGSKPVLLDKKPRHQWAEWVYAAQNFSKALRVIHKGFETRKRRLTEGQIHNLYDRCPSLLRDWDKFRTAVSNHCAATPRLHP